MRVWIVSRLWNFVRMLCCELSGLLIATMCFIGDEMVFGFGRLVKVLIKEMY